MAEDENTRCGKPFIESVCGGKGNPRSGLPRPSRPNVLWKFDDFPLVCLKLSGSIAFIEKAPYTWLRHGLYFQLYS